MGMCVHTLIKDYLKMLKNTKADVTEVNNNTNFFKTCFDIQVF